jgi:hypothetical protein
MSGAKVFATFQNVMGRTCRPMRMEQMRNAYRILVGNLETRHDLGYLDENARIILKFILKKRE